MTSGQEMEQVYSFNPGARMGQVHLENTWKWLLKWKRENVTQIGEQVKRNRKTETCVQMDLCSARHELAATSQQLPSSP